jgi:rod shape-determining protein MreD
MNPYAAATLLVGVAALQAAAGPHLAVMDIRPNLPLVIVTAWGLLRGSAEGVWWGLGAGLATDLFAGVPLGMFSSGLTLAGLVAGTGERHVFRTHFLIPIVMIAANTLLANGAALGMMALLDWPVRLWETMTSAVLPEIAYNAAVMLLVLPAMGWLSRKTEGERIGL